MKTLISVPTPDLQIGFSFALEQIREAYLQEALGTTISLLDISHVDKELTKYVSKKSLSELAKVGLRGELLFPVPIILKANPQLIAYYRLLLGFSKKEFYQTENGLSRFKSLEEKNVLSSSNEILLPKLCLSLVKSAENLLEGIGIKRISKSLFDDLTLLTLGPFLRGNDNVKKGINSIRIVFDIISKIVTKQTISSNKSQIKIKNAAGRYVYIEFSSDPDIIIREEMSENNYRNMIAIEVKGGTDFSNIHNRIGEAEKSHQKARSEGFVECWTIVNVDKMDKHQANKESPSTNNFYIISKLKNKKDEEFIDFENRIISLTGISNA